MADRIEPSAVTLHRPTCHYPTTNGGYAKMEGQLEYIYLQIAYTFCTFGADLYPQSVLINKISESDFSRRFIKSALLVG